MRFIGNHSFIYSHNHLNLKSPSGELINESMEHLFIAQIETKLQPFLN